MFQICATDDPTLTGLAAGEHVVTMRATLPGTTMVITSDALTVALRCDPATEPAPEPAPATGGCSAAGPSAGPWLAVALLGLVRATRRRRRG